MSLPTVGALLGLLVTLPNVVRLGTKPTTRALPRASTLLVAWAVAIEAKERQGASVERTMGGSLARGFLSTVVSMREGKLKLTERGQLCYR